MQQVIGVGTSNAGDSPEAAPEGGPEVSVWMQAQSFESHRHHRQKSTIETPPKTFIFHKHHFHVRYSGPISPRVRAAFD